MGRLEGCLEGRKRGAEKRDEMKGKQRVETGAEQRAEMTPKIGANLGVEWRRMRGQKRGGETAVGT
jgi:hypothetical protein